MLRLTLQQMRLSAGRLVAAGLAIMLGTAFVAATLAGTGAMERTTFNALSASYGEADLVVETDWTHPQTSNSTSAGEHLDEIRATPGVSDAEATLTQWWDLGFGQKVEISQFEQLPAHPRLITSGLSEGEYPSTAGEVAIGEALANRLGVAIGDEVSLTSRVWDSESSDQLKHTISLTVTGTLSDGGSYFAGPVSNYVSEDDFNELNGFMTDSDANYRYYGDSVRIAVDADASITQVQSDLSAMLPGKSVQTPDEKAAETASEISGMSNPFTYVLLAFAAVALIVAALVISNTFQVLVAQRTRTLALLRCVGASGRQVKRSVRQEALILGFLASIAGLIAGVGLIQVLLRVLAHYNPGLPIDHGLHLAVPTLLITVGIGMLVTYFAASSPARAATRVAPLAALRPLEAAPVAGGGKFRKAVSILFIMAGVGMLAFGAYLGMGNTSLDTDTAVILGLGIGIIGGFTSLVGLLIGAIFIVPAVIRLLGRIGKNSVPWKIAVENAIRNPRRTANTTNALVIGVALVMMFATGASTARTTLDAMLDDEFPMDLSVSSSDWYGSNDVAGMTPAQISAVEATDGIETSTHVLGAVGNWSFPEIRDDVTFGDEIFYAADELDDVLRTPNGSIAVAADEVLIPQWMVYDWDLPQTGEVLIEINGTSREFNYRTSSVEGLDLPMLSVETLTELADDPVTVGIYAKISTTANATDVVSSLQSTMVSLSEVDPSAPLMEMDGSAMMRQAFGQIIDILLLVVIALLAVAVVIALIGVANTLSLSVLERRRESAMLRAMGLTKGQLRTMLTFEGLFIAGVGAGIGVIAGLIYGWAGAAVILGGIGQDIVFQVPWLEVAAIAVIALIAGILASLVPSRTATKPSPIEALATD